MAHGGREFERKRCSWTKLTIRSSRRQRRQRTHSDEPQEIDAHRTRIESEQRRRDELREGFTKLKNSLPVSGQRASKTSLLDRGECLRSAAVRRAEQGESQLSRTSARSRRPTATCTRPTSVSCEKMKSSESENSCRLAFATPLTGPLTSSNHKLVAAQALAVGAIRDNSDSPAL